jgi:hypothetical protein
MPVSHEYNLNVRSFDKEKITAMLCDTHDFSRERVSATLEKLEHVHTSKKQKGLGDFF